MIQAKKDLYKMGKTTESKIKYIFLEKNKHERLTKKWNFKKRNVVME